MHAVFTVDVVSHYLRQKWWWMPSFGGNEYFRTIDKLTYGYFPSTLTANGFCHVHSAVRMFRVSRALAAPSWRCWRTPRRTAPSTVTQVRLDCLQLVDLSSETRRPERLWVCTFRLFLFLNLNSNPIAFWADHGLTGHPVSLRLTPWTFTAHWFQNPRIFPTFI